MRICDLCKNNPASPDVGAGFDAMIGGIYFKVWVTMKKGPQDTMHLDICPDCAAKGALAVLGVNPTEEKKP